MDPELVAGEANLCRVMSSLAEVKAMRTRLVEQPADVAAAAEAEAEGEGEDGAIVGRPRTRSQRKKLSRARKVLILEETAEQEKALRKRAKKAKAAVSQVSSALDLFTKKVRY